MYASPAPSLRADQRPGKYLTFKLGREEFGIRVVKVREIMGGVQGITALPQTPDYLKGVINLRGKEVPVIDLRLKFGLPATEHTKKTCIIVVQVESEAGSILVGVVVDEASKVLDITSSDIQDIPSGATPATPFILGMAKVNGKVKFLLDIDRVVSAQEMAALGETAGETLACSESLERKGAVVSGGPDSATASYPNLRPGH